MNQPATYRPYITTATTALSLSSPWVDGNGSTDGSGRGIIYYCPPPGVIGDPLEVTFTATVDAATAVAVRSWDPDGANTCDVDPNCGLFSSGSPLATLNRSLVGTSAWVPSPLPLEAEVFHLSADAPLGVKTCTLTGEITDMGYDKPQGDTLTIWGDERMSADCGNSYLPYYEAEVSIRHTPPYGSGWWCEEKGPFNDDDVSLGFGPAWPP